MSTSATRVGDDAPVRAKRADARRNRELLVAAARRVFAARGSDTAMEEIAREAGVGIGTLYRNFARRIDLVEAVYREDVTGLVDAAERLSATLQPWPALEAWLGEFLRYAAAKRTFLTELHEAFERVPDLAVDSRARIAGAAGLVLSGAQRAGVARTDLDAPDLMQLVGGLCMAKSSDLARNQRLLALVLDGIRTGR